MPKLQILDGERAGKVFDLQGDSQTIGRSSDCDVCLSDASISRHHAVIESADTGRRIRDLGSRNKLYCGGEKVEEAELKGRTELKVGTIRVLFTEDQSADTSDVSQTKPETSTLEPEAATTAAGYSGAVADTGTGREPPLVMSDTEDPEKLLEDIGKMSRIYPQMEQEFSRVIIGQRQVLEELLVAIAAGGHCLMIGLPGLAKTLMVRTLADIMELDFQRIQFTPDLMPSDIIGTDVLEVDENTGKKSFRFVKGPVFTNMLLGDEINRSPPKTQAALLESMQEQRVTAGNHVFELDPPFFVLATQNPLEQEGTYPLPEAQLDRFMFNIIVHYPSEEEEENIVYATTRKQQAAAKPLLTGQDLLQLQQAVRELPVSNHVIKYATRLSRATRPEEKYAPDFIRNYISCGAGPRAAQFLILGAKARAVLHGRHNVGCQDIRDLALPVLRHRLFTNFAADSEGITPDQLIEKLIAAVAEPDQADYADARAKS